jgi:protein-tyrosine-phosphatase
MPSILFVCTANICRSPIAMGMLRNMLEERHIEGDWQVDSAGTWGLEGDPPAAGSRAVMENVGIDISDHKARRVDYDLLKSYDLILTMELGHKEALCMEFTEFAERIYMLSEMAGDKSDIKDPYGGPYSGYEQAAEDIQLYLENGFDTIIQLASHPG